MLDTETQRIIGEPEGLTLEYRAVVPAPYVLARLLSAFANTNGGTIIIGIREQNGKIEITGLKGKAEAEKSLKIALTMLHPVPKIKCNFKQLGDRLKNHKIFMLFIEKSLSTITYKGDVYYRQGTKIIKNIQSSSNSQTPEDFESDVINVGKN